jgi:hypothetical protein
MPPDNRSTALLSPITAISMLPDRAITPYSDVP